MSDLDENKPKQLCYVSKLVIECFKEAGLDQFYIDDKIEEFSELSNYAALHKALRILDDNNMIRLAHKLEVSVTDLESTLKVLSKI